MSLTANQPEKTMLDKKYKWKTKKAASAPLSSKMAVLVQGGEADAAKNMFNFEPLRIRQFEIEFNKLEVQKLATSPNQISVGGLNLDEQKASTSDFHE